MPAPTVPTIGRQGEDGGGPQDTLPAILAAPVMRAHDEALNVSSATALVTRMQCGAVLAGPLRAAVTTALVGLLQAHTFR